MFLDPLRQRRDQVVLFGIEVGVPAESRVSNCLIVLVTCTTHDDIASRTPRYCSRQLLPHCRAASQQMWQDSHGKSVRHEIEHT